MESLKNVSVWLVLISIWLAAVTGFAQEPFTTYTEAYQRSIIEDRPLVVLVSAPWCAPCQALKREIANLDKQEKERVVFALVDFDKDRPLAQRIMGDSVVIPHVAAYRRDGTRLVLIGAQSRQRILTFLELIKKR